MVGQRPVVELTHAPDVLTLGVRSALVRRRPPGLPDVELRQRQVPTDVDRLAAYSRLCGYDVSGVLPPTYLHVLTFPVQTALMGRSDFPFPLAGLVHVAQRLQAHRAVRVGETLDLAVHAERLRPHRRGRQVDLVSRARVGGETVFEGVSTYLHREPAAADGVEARQDGVPVAVDPTSPPHTRWRLPADLGRRYAAVSGDDNPIHLSPVTAKAFGFPRTIAHGMWSLARCLASVGPRVAVTDVVRAELRRPVLLPSTVELRAVPASGGWDGLLTQRTRPDEDVVQHLRFTTRGPDGAVA